MEFELNKHVWYGFGKLIPQRLSTWTQEPLRSWSRMLSPAKFRPKHGSSLSLLWSLFGGGGCSSLGAHTWGQRQNLQAQKASIRRLPRLEMSLKPASTESRNFKHRRSKDGDFPPPTQRLHVAVRYKDMGLKRVSTSEAWGLSLALARSLPLSPYIHVYTFVYIHICHSSVDVYLLIRIAYICVFQYVYIYIYIHNYVCFSLFVFSPGAAL